MIIALIAGPHMAGFATAEMNTQAFRLNAEGDAERVSDDVLTVLGRPGRSDQQFATDYSRAFSKSAHPAFPAQLQLRRDTRSR